MGFDEGHPRPLAGADGIDLNAFVKGWIVDRATDLVVADAGEDASVLVSAGGDLRQHGPAAVMVGVENPLRPYDNEPPIAVVELRDAAMATSGSARRGVRIGDVWYPHVIDPRTGDPATRVASISVIADTAAMADVAATVAGLQPADHCTEIATELDVACLAIADDGTRHHNATWVHYESAAREVATRSP